MNAKNRGAPPVLVCAGKISGEVAAGGGGEARGRTWTARAAGRMRGGLHGLALDEVLAGDAGDVGRRREVDGGGRALLGRDREGTDERHADVSEQAEVALAGEVAGDEAGMQGVGRQDVGVGAAG